MSATSSTAELGILNEADVNLPAPFRTRKLSAHVLLLDEQFKYKVRNMI